MPDVAIVGGGIIGAACAYELARAGASVTLIERDELAAGASGRNQGGSWSRRTRSSRRWRERLAHVPDVAATAPLPVWIDRDPSDICW